MTPRSVDYCAAACADAKVENLTIAEMQIAWELSDTEEQFFYALQGAIALNNVIRSGRPDLYEVRP